MSESLTLRQLRIKAKLSREKFAHMAGLDYRTMTSAEIMNHPIDAATAQWLLAVLKAHFEQHPELVAGFKVPEKPGEIRGLMLKADQEG